MEKERKLLKEMSILVLIFVGLSLFRMVSDVILNGFASTVVIEGVSQELANVLVIVALCCSLLFLLLEVYVGCKGLKMARNPDGSKRHITIAIIILVCLIISLIYTILELTKEANLIINIITIADVFIDVAVYYLYIRCAKKIRRQYQN